MPVDFQFPTFELPKITLPDIYIALPAWHEIYQPAHDYLDDCWNLTKNLAGDYGYPEGSLAPVNISDHQTLGWWLIGSIVVLPATLISNFIASPIMNSWQTFSYRTGVITDWVFETRFSKDPNYSDPNAKNIANRPDLRNWVRQWLQGGLGGITTLIAAPIILFSGFINETRKSFVSLTLKMVNAIFNETYDANDQRASTIRRFVVGGMGQLIAIGMLGPFFVLGGLFRESWKSLVVATKTMYHFAFDAKLNGQELAAETIEDPRHPARKVAGGLGYAAAVIPGAFILAGALIRESVLSCIARTLKMVNAIFNETYDDNDKRASTIRRFVVGGMGQLIAIGMLGPFFVLGGLFRESWKSLVVATKTMYHFAFDAKLNGQELAAETIEDPRHPARKVAGGLGYAAAVIPGAFILAGALIRESVLSCIARTLKMVNAIFNETYDANDKRASTIRRFVVGGMGQLIAIGMLGPFFVLGGLFRESWKSLVVATKTMYHFAFDAKLNGQELAAETIEDPRHPARKVAGGLGYAAAVIPGAFILAGALIRESVLSCIARTLKMVNAIFNETYDDNDKRASTIRRFVVGGMGQLIAIGMLGPFFVLGGLFRESWKSLVVATKTMYHFAFDAKLNGQELAAETIEDPRHPARKVAGGLGYAAAVIPGAFILAGALIRESVLSCIARTLKMVNAIFNETYDDNDKRASTIRRFVVGGMGQLIAIGMLGPFFVLGGLFRESWKSLVVATKTMYHFAFDAKLNGQELAAETIEDPRHPARKVAGGLGYAAAVIPGAFILAGALIRESVLSCIARTLKMVNAIFNETYDDNDKRASTIRRFVVGGMGQLIAIGMLGPFFVLGGLFRESWKSLVVATKTMYHFAFDAKLNGQELAAETIEDPRHPARKVAGGLGYAAAVIPGAFILAGALIRESVLSCIARTLKMVNAIFNETYDDNDKRASTIRRFVVGGMGQLIAIGMLGPFFVLGGLFRESWKSLVVATKTMYHFAFDAKLNGQELAAETIEDPRHPARKVAGGLGYAAAVIPGAFILAGALIRESVLSCIARTLKMVNAIFNETYDDNDKRASTIRRFVVGGMGQLIAIGMLGPFFVLGGLFRESWKSLVVATKTMYHFAFDAKLNGQELAAETIEDPRHPARKVAGGLGYAAAVIPGAFILAGALIRESVLSCIARTLKMVNAIFNETYDANDKRASTIRRFVVGGMGQLIAIGMLGPFFVLGGLFRESWKSLVVATKTMYHFAFDAKLNGQELAAETIEDPRHPARKVAGGLGYAAAVIPGAFILAGALIRESVLSCIARTLKMVNAIFNETYDANDKRASTIRRFVVGGMGQLIAIGMLGPFFVLGGLFRESWKSLVVATKTMYHFAFDAKLNGQELAAETIEDPRHPARKVAGGLGYAAAVIPGAFILAGALIRESVLSCIARTLKMVNAIFNETYDDNDKRASTIRRFVVGGMGQLIAIGMLGPFFVLGGLFRESWISLEAATKAIYHFVFDTKRTDATAETNTTTTPMPERSVARHMMGCLGYLTAGVIPGIFFYTGAVFIESWRSFKALTQGMVTGIFGGEPGAADPRVSNVRKAVGVLGYLAALAITPFLALGGLVRETWQSFFGTIKVTVNWTLGTQYSLGENNRHPARQALGVLGYLTAKIASPLVIVSGVFASFWSGHTGSRINNPTENTPHWDYIDTPVGKWGGIVLGTLLCPIVGTAIGYIGLKNFAQEEYWLKNIKPPAIKVAILTAAILCSPLTLIYKLCYLALEPAQFPIVLKSQNSSKLDSLSEVERVFKDLFKSLSAGGKLPIKDGEIIKDEIKICVKDNNKPKLTIVGFGSFVRKVFTFNTDTATEKTLERLLADYKKYCPEGASGAYSFFQGGVETTIKTLKGSYSDKEDGEERKLEIETAANAIKNYFALNRGN